VRASRLLTIQLLLETRGRMSAQALADTLEISVRTLYRDIDQLAAAGVPIYAERGRGGGFQLLDGWRTTLTGFTTAEAQAVFMSGLAGPAGQLGLGREVADAQLKLLAALPLHQRHDAQRMQTRFHLDTVDWYREGEALPQLAPVATAVWRDQQLAIRYESWSGVTEQTLHPLGLVLKAGIWYLVAAIAGQPRTYRISNISSCSMLDASAQRPDGFDLASYWSGAVQRFEQSLYQGAATVLATPAGLRALARLSAAVERAVATTTPAHTDRDGRCSVTIPIETIAHAVGQLLPLAPDVEVVDPPALRQALQQRLQEIGSRYGLTLQKT
jgi:predicted DNA-binding transcriptional regulator YafY